MLHQIVAWFLAIDVDRWTKVGTAVGVLGTFGASIFATMKMLPIWLSNIELSRELASEKRRADLAEKNAEDEKHRADTLESIIRANSEVKEALEEQRKEIEQLRREGAQQRRELGKLRDEVAVLSRKYAIGVIYMADVGVWSHDPTSGPMPTVPEEFQADVAAALKQHPHILKDG